MKLNSDLLKGIVEQISDNYIKIGNMKIVIGNVSYKTTTLNTTSNTYFTSVGIDTPVDFTLGKVFCQLSSGNASRTLSARPFGQIVNGHHTDILVQSDIENYENSLDYLVIGK